MKISGGVYLVIDPSIPKELLLTKVGKAILGGVDIIQIWDHWQPGQDKISIIKDICDLAHKHDIPVLINRNWELLIKTMLDGVHFDEPPSNLQEIRKKIDRPFIAGITGGNDLNSINRAIGHGIDYVSFCAMFPSKSANSCELVRPETVARVRAMTNIPLFVSGGITPSNMASLAGTGLDGVAVISGIMESQDPEAATALYKNELLRIKNRNV